MSADQPESELHRVPPAGEEIHMPESSILPLLNAVGLAFAIISLTLSWILVGAGLLLFLATAVKWIADVRRDIGELPLEHRGH